MENLFFIFPIQTLAETTAVGANTIKIGFELKLSQQTL